jgi:hypothetical protein
MLSVTSAVPSLVVYAPSVTHTETDSDTGGELEHEIPEEF